MTDVPFETDENGLYHLTQPFNEIRPTSLTITVNGVTYAFSDFKGNVTRSRIYEDTLAYGTCEVVDE